jgi:hypothetical protein
MGIGGSDCYRRSAERRKSMLERMKRRSRFKDYMITERSCGNKFK